MCENSNSGVTKESQQRHLSDFTDRNSILFQLGDLSAFQVAELLLELLSSLRDDVADSSDAVEALDRTDKVALGFFDFMGIKWELDSRLHRNPVAPSSVDQDTRLER